MVVAIDGPAGSGKSTIAKMLAEKLGLMFMNTGSFYRGVTLALLRSGGGGQDGAGGNMPDLYDEAAIISFAEGVPLDYRNGHLFLGEEDVDSLLRSDAVEALVAPVSAIVGVRHIVNQKIRAVAESSGIVCEGRDMTTVVFPNADYKFFLDASPAARAKRRFDQGTSSLTLAQIEASIAERDQVDRNKKEGSLKIAPEAVYLDTSDLTINGVCDIMVSKIHL